MILSDELFINEMNRLNALYRRQVSMKMYDIQPHRTPEYNEFMKSQYNIEMECFPDEIEDNFEVGDKNILNMLFI